MAESQLILGLFLVMAGVLALAVVALRRRAILSQESQDRQAALLRSVLRRGPGAPTRRGRREKDAGGRRREKDADGRRRETDADGRRRETDAGGQPRTAVAEQPARPAAPGPAVHRLVLDGQEREPRLPAQVVAGSARHGSFFHGWCGTTSGPHPTARLNVRGVTLRGVGHAEQDLEGQDVIGAAWDDRRGVLYVAVADGVGSLPRSGRVAQEAITAVLHLCLTRPDDIAFDATGARLFEAVAAGLVRSLGGDDARIDGASTLIVAEIAPRFDGAYVTVHGVGDSEAWALYAGAWIPLHHERGGGDNATRELPGHVRPHTQRYDLSPGAVLVLGSDGFTGALDESVSPLSRGLARLWRRRPTWLEFLNHVSFVDDYWSDDRSAVAVWIGEGPADA
ncbi:protein phosphatase 2C domain-containing protein [Actinoplanes sp. NPDC026670]|uniref:protein phosphatase 2C domain-containing protein n=1 Tax=Actinoplanes sp. NPDC026670 TaxID=3154700 RepID=UPI0033E69905